MFLFLLFAALLACFGADGDRHAARRDVRADVGQRVPAPKRLLPFVAQ
jgi:hypothetical protein